MLLRTNIFSLVFIVTSSLFLSCNGEDKPSKKTMIDIGDSLTKGALGDGNSMTIVASNLLGKEWDVQNMGVGGENTLTIGARFGALPMYINESIVLPQNGDKVEISKGLYSSYNDKKVFPLKQKGEGINPCKIDTIQCILTREEDKYYINRIFPSDADYKTQFQTTIVTALTEQKSDILTIFIGQNGGYSSPEELLDQIDLFVKHKGDDNVIIITSHGNTTERIDELVSEKYKNKYINLREYMTTNAIKDAIDFGLLPDNGEYPTQEDLDRMKKNKAPKSVLSDNIHFNSLGYELLGRLRYKKGRELGYW